MNRLLFALLASPFLIVSCSQPNDGTDNPIPPIYEEHVSVYVAGDSFDATTSFLPRPIYWKNGKQVHLPHPGYSSGNSLLLSGSDVYVTSSGEFAGNNVTFWKNGVGVNLADPSITYPATRNITISGSDIYTVGIAYINNFEKIVPIYWKNQEQAVKIPAPYTSDARSIAVSGNDIYITGSMPNIAAGYGYSSACYWKNGVPVFLNSATTISENGLAKSISVVGTDIHAIGEVYLNGGGFQMGTATYWKNSVPHALTGHDSLSFANSLLVVNNDIYIAGAVSGPDKQFHAAYWKNGALTVLAQTYSFANSIAVFEGNVYVVGNRSSDTALIWKNGVETVLGRGRANAVVVRRE